MDKVSYEQITLPRDLLGDAAAFLQDGMLADITAILGAMDIVFGECDR